MSRDMVVATRNRAKLTEIKSLLDSLGIQIFSLDDIAFLGEIIESGSTYLENARIKSSVVTDFCGKITLADDSGLEIDALNGQPGVHSARFGGEGLDFPGKIDLALRLLQDISPEKRTARFRCVISIQHPDGNEFNCEGVCDGLIAGSPKGKLGFGYDPVFFLPEYGKTMAELNPGEKNRISHRGKALEKVREELRRLIQIGTLK